jgi:Lar family restriction alleviation protein
MMDLLPCPLCGGKGEQRNLLVGVNMSHRHDIACHDCGTRTRPYKRKHDAVSRWNTRKYRPMNQALDKRHHTLYAPTHTSATGAGVRR